MQIFFQLQKVDEKTGIVSGRAVEEVLDHAGEIFDYAKSKPHFEAWSANIAKATDGKSAGNVRAMHGKVSAGILKDIQFVDAEKAIDVTALINDPVEKAKLIAGNYTGFSIGGSYVAKWEDPVHKGVMRYEAQPAEISIVDLPCVPTATFTAIKADGSSELRKFHAPAADANDAGAPPADTAAATAAGAPIEKSAAAGEGTTPGEATKPVVEPPAAAASVEKIAERSDTSPKEGESKYGDVKFADEKNKKYPIDTPAHIRAAWNYINKPKNAAKYDAKDVKSIKSKIVAAWKDKIDSAGPPSAEKATDTDCEKLAALDCRAAFLAKHEPAQRLLATLNSAYGKPEIAKGMWNIADLACLIDNLQYIAASTQAEAEWEGDNSAIPGELRDSVKELAGLLGDMVDEEVEELVSQYEGMDTMVGEEVEVIELAAKIGELLKSDSANGAMREELRKIFDSLGFAAPAPQPLAKVTKAVLDETTHALTKARADLKTANEELAKAKARVDELEKLPAAKAPVLRVVGKGDDNGTPIGTEKVADVSPVMVGGQEDPFATRIKKIRAQQMRKD